MLAVGPATTKEATQAIEDYPAIENGGGGGEEGEERGDVAKHPEQCQLSQQKWHVGYQHKQLLLAMMVAMTRQTALLQQLLAQVKAKPAKPQQICFRCGGLHLQNDNQKESKHQSGSNPTQKRNARLWPDHRTQKEPVTTQDRRDGWTVVKRRRGGKKKARTGKHSSKPAQGKLVGSNQQTYQQQEETEI